MIYANVYHGDRIGTMEGDFDFAPYVPLLNPVCSFTGERYGRVKSFLSCSNAMVRSLVCPMRRRR